MSQIIKVPLRIVQSMKQYQSRAETSLDLRLVAEYADRYRQKLPMDPIQVCGQKHTALYIVDGHHRFEALKQAYGDMQAYVDVEVVDTRTDPSVVRWNAAGSNTKHGKPRTPADKRKAVEMVLQDYPNTSDAQIAQHCDVSRMFVFKLRDELGIPHPQNEQIAARQASAPMPPPPPPPSPSEGDETRNGVVNVYNGVSSEEPQARPAIPPPPASPPDEGEEPPAIQRPPIPPPPPRDESTAGRSKVSQMRLKDELMRPIPADLREFYARRAEVMTVATALRGALATIRKGMGDNDPLWACIDANTVTSLENVVKTVEDCRPWAVCPVCSGMSTSCQWCGNRGGFISKKQAENIKQTEPELWALLHRVQEKNSVPPPPAPREETPYEAP